MDYQLTGKTALITGGATGIGKAIARRFILEGARVVISGLNEEELGAALQELGEGSSGMVADLTDNAEAERLVALASEAGPIDFLNNNVGIFEGRDLFGNGDPPWPHSIKVPCTNGLTIRAPR